MTWNHTPKSAVHTTMQVILLHYTSITMNKFTECHKKYIFSPILRTFSATKLSLMTIYKAMVLNLWKSPSNNKN
jgi:hypothetical protein